MSKTLDILSEQVWAHPGDYAGHNPVGDFVIYSRHRDSSIMENVNYNLICAELGAVDDDFSAPVYTFRAGHWAVGWVEYIILKKEAPEDVLEKAAEILSALSDYPILSDDAYSEAQFEAIVNYWEDETIRGRVEWCYEAGESIFAARRDFPADAVFDHLMQGDQFQ
jgi:hypothetical protein